MKNPDQDEMRPEYDFSDAVRGKHGARFAVERGEAAPGWLKDAIRYDQIAWISEALRRFQELEGLLVAYLTLAFHLEPGDAGRDVRHLLEDPEREALSRIRGDLDPRALAPSGDLWRRLERLFSERDWFVHRSLQQRVGDESPRTSGRFTARLQQLSSEAVAITEQLRQMILDRFARTGMKPVEFEERARAAIRQWLAA